MQTYKHTNIQPYTYIHATIRTHTSTYTRTHIRTHTRRLISWC